jgi:hypothetical protein
MCSEMMIADIKNAKRNSFLKNHGYELPYSEEI